MRNLCLNSDLKEGKGKGHESIRKRDFRRKLGTSSAKSPYIRRLTACAKSKEDSVSAAERRQE